MKPSSIQCLVLIAAVALLSCVCSSVVAQDSGYSLDPESKQRVESKDAMTPDSRNEDSVTAGFGESTDDFLNRKIASKKVEAQSSGWSLFGQTLGGYPAKKTAATVVLALSISLLALYFLRMKPGRRRGGLPDDVVSMLGQIPFGPNQRLQLVRLGSKLLLITTSQNGSHTLGEITDPEEVLQIESICRNGKFDTIGQTLRNRAQAASAANSRPRQSAAQAGRTLLEA